MGLPANLIQLVVGVVIGLGATSAAMAKGGPLGFWPQAPDAVMHETLETPYAQAMLKTFAANARKSGDAACLEEKKLDEAALIGKGRALWQAYGTRFLKLQDENFDDAVAQSAFATLAGPKARAEFDRLLQHRDVKKLEELNRPNQTATLLETVVEQFDRYVLVARIKLDPVSPTARGESDSEAARANPEAAVDRAIQQFMKKNPSPKAIDRFFELMDALLQATRMGVKREGLVKLGPMEYFAGLDKDLAELCVGKR